MGKKLKTLIPIAIVVVIGYFAMIQIRFFLYTMKVREDVDSLGRFPSIQNIIGLKAKLQATAESSHIPLETWSETTKIEGRNQGPLRFYYVVATVKDGPRDFTYEIHRIENDAVIVSEAGIAELADAKIEVIK
jgi:hypothetical protein